MKLRDLLLQIRQIRIPRERYPVEGTVAEELLSSLGFDAVIQSVDPSEMKSEKGIFYIAVVNENLMRMLLPLGLKLPSDKE